MTRSQSLFLLLVLSVIWVNMWLYSLRVAVDALGIHTILGVEQVVGDADGAVGAPLVRVVDRE